MRIEIHGRDLPRGYGARGDAAVGIQRKTDVEQRFPTEISEPTWVAEATPHPTPDGGFDLRGPYVHGRRGDRFLYLSWARAGADGKLAMVRRAKLMLAAVDPAVLAAAAEPGGVLVGELGLTGADGTPLCAAVRPPAISWRASSERPATPG